MRAKVENRKNIVRDLNNRALLFIDKEELKNYKQKINLENKYNKLSKELTHVKNDLRILKDDLKSMISLLKENLSDEKGQND
jgi:hypothetical protein